MTHIPERDSEGYIIQRQMVSLKDMVFRPRVFDFTLGKYGSLHNQDSGGNDLGDATLHFFDSSFTELTKGETETDLEFQTRLDSSCVHTWLYFTPTTKIGIIAGSVRRLSEIDKTAYIWFEVAPHIPKAYGGSVPFIEGGIPIDMLPELEQLRMDGKACVILDVDPVNATNRIGIKCSHTAGDTTRLMPCLEIYV